MAVGNTSYATLATVTLQNFQNEIFNNVVTNLAALNELKMAGNIKVVGGGRKFNHPVYYKQNSTFAAIDKFGTIPTDLQDPLTRAEYDIKTIAGSIVYSIVEEAMNAGSREKLIDYVDSLKMVAQSSMTEVMGDQVMQAEASVGTDDFDSIPKIIADSASTQTTSVGGIDSSASGQEFWQNYVYSTAVTAFGTSQAGLNAMDTALNGATKGRQGPTFGITTAAIFTLYQLSLTANVRYSSLERGEAGFKNLLYSTIPVMIDDNCPADHLYFIDGNSLKLQVLSQGNMKITAFQQAYSQLMARSMLYMLGNLTCGSRRTNAVITSITG